MQPSPLRLAWLVLILLLCGLAGVTLAVQPVAAQSGTGGEGVPKLQLVGQVGGAIRAADVREPYAYVGLGPQFAVLDLSNPEHPRRVGSVMLSALIKSIDIEGEYAYVATWDGLTILNVQNPSNPVWLGHLPLAFAHEVVVAGQYAYVLAGVTPTMPGYGLHIVDISVPGRPRAVGFWEGGGSRVAVADGLAYVAGAWVEDSSVQIIDVSDPAAPARVGGFYIERGKYDIAVRDGYAYVAVMAQRDSEDVCLVIVNVSVPAAPREEGRGYCYIDRFQRYVADMGIAVEGHYAYIAGINLQAFDVSNPAQPRKLELSNDIEMGGIVLSSEYLYTLAGGSKFSIYERLSPTSLRELGRFDTIAAASDVAVSGGYAYVTDLGGASDEAGLHVVDVTAPSEPEMVGHLPIDGDRGRDSGVSLSRVAVSGTLAYLAGREYEMDSGTGEGVAFLAVADVQDPTRPTHAGGFVAEPSEQPCAIDAVTMAGRYIYTNICGFGIFDASEPTSPTLVALPDYALDDIAVEGAYAYGTGDVNPEDGFENPEPGLSVFDLSQPDRPERVGSVSIPIPSETVLAVKGVAISGTHAYIAGYEAGFRIIDISRPNNPVEVGFHDIRYDRRQFLDVALWGDYAFVMENNWDSLYFYTGGVGIGGLRVYNVSDPTHPRLVDYYNTEGLPQHITIHDGLIYLADREGGLLVFRFAPLHYQYLPFSFSSSGPS